MAVCIMLPYLNSFEVFATRCATSSQVCMQCSSTSVATLHSPTGLPQSEVDTMALGLSHSLSRYKLKFSPDKVDVMIIQAIALLDDLDKELNNYNMRCREWYGWHFPELGKMISDNLTYARVVKTLGMRGNIVDADLASVLEEEVEEEVRAAAEVSMGTEISDQDMDNINHLCEQVIEISEYRYVMWLDVALWSWPPDTLQRPAL